MLPLVWHTVWAGLGMAAGRIQAQPYELQRILVRDIAHWLRAREGEEKTVVLSEPGLTTQLVYHGGFKGIGTLYWENRDGLKAAVEIFSTTDDRLAQERVRQRGITHIVVTSWANYTATTSRLAGDAPNPAHAKNTLIATLQRGRGCPLWLRPVHYPMPADERLAQDRVLVYEVVPEQSREQGALRYAQYLFANNESEGAKKLLQALLQHYPDSLGAWITLAQIELDQKRSDAQPPLRSRLRIALPWPSYSPQLNGWMMRRSNCARAGRRPTNAPYGISPMTPFSTCSHSPESWAKQVSDPSWFGSRATFFRHSCALNWGLSVAVN
jgi:hypothetical protein